MMNYNAHCSDTGSYFIVETQTGLMVDSGLSKDQAKARVRFLNFGGGFDGWSPSFIHQRIELA